jgi:hypothetical protein
MTIFPHLIRNVVIGPKSDHVFHVVYTCITRGTERAGSLSVQLIWQKHTHIMLHVGWMDLLDNPQEPIWFEQSSSVVILEVAKSLDGDT